MRVLSTKLKMIERFSEQDFIEIVIKWLKNAGPCKAIGEQLERSETIYGRPFKAEYCDFQTQKILRDNTTYYMLKLEQEFHGQNWTTEIIYADGENKTVYFHIDCSGDVSLFNEAPKMRTAIIRDFVNSGKILQPAIKISAQPIKLNDDTVNTVAEYITGKIDNEVPLVFASQYFDSSAFPISENSLAEFLCGIAYVVYSNNEFTRILKEKTNGKAFIPFNGGVAIYCKNQKPKQLRKYDVYYGGTLDIQVENEVMRIVNAQVEKTAPSWNKLVIAEQSELLEVADGLDERAKRDAIRIAELGQENVQLKARVEYLESALSERSSEQRLIVKSDIPEFFDGEQNDLIVAILNRELTKCGDNIKTRKYELLSSIVNSNSFIGNKQKMFERIKEIFSDGETMSATERAELEKMGFEIEEDGKHYKFRFMGSKYWYTVSKTPSDTKRGGKNVASKIIDGLSIYK